MPSLPDEHILSPLMSIRVMLIWQRADLLVVHVQTDAQPGVLCLTQTQVNKDIFCTLYFYKSNFLNSIMD